MLDQEEDESDKSRKTCEAHEHTVGCNIGKILPFELYHNMGKILDKLQVNVSQLLTNVD